MISTTWTKAPADLLGLGGIDVRPVFGPGLCSWFAEYLVAPVDAPMATARGAALPAGGTAVRVRVRLRPVTRQATGQVVVTTNFFQNNGTTLGNLSPGRPQS
jgi:hypothetical protein